MGFECDLNAPISHDSRYPGTNSRPEALGPHYAHISLLCTLQCTVHFMLVRTVILFEISPHNVITDPALLDTDLSLFYYDIRRMLMFIFILKLLSVSLLNILWDGESRHFCSFILGFRLLIKTKCTYF